MADSGNPQDQHRQPIWREPIVHFLLVGGLLFVLASLRSLPDDSEGFRIHVGRERVAVLYNGFARDFGREPTEEELQELVDEYIRTEVCVREARSLGLDRDDQLIRDHLRSKYELLLDDGSEPPTPDEEELEQFLAEHPDRYRTEPALSFMQIYLDPLQREEAELDAELLLGELTGEEDLGLVQALSDPGSLPPRLPLVALSEIGWQFDPLFADAVQQMPVGQWSGPVISSYGVHLVLIEERREGRQLELGEIRSDVETDWLDEQLRQRLNAELDRVMQAYDIEVDDYELAGLAETATSAEGGEEEPAQ